MVFLCNCPVFASVGRFCETDEAMECDNSVNPVGNRSRLLVAEDNPSNYKLVEVLLRRDYDLLHAWNGEEAVALFADCRPDLVLMDINMPVMDGYEALRGVREISPDVPVIALTAYAFETDRHRMFQAGFNECLAKPLRADELRTRIAALLSR